MGRLTIWGDSPFRQPTDDELGRFLNTRRVPKGHAYVEERPASQAAHAMGLGAVDYGLAEWQGRACSTCGLFNTADVPFVPVCSALPRRAVAQFGLNRALFCGEPDSSLALDDLLAAHRRYTGAFATCLEAQLGYSMEEPSGCGSRPRRPCPAARRRLFR